MARMNVLGLGHGLDGDLTTTGAICIGSLPNCLQEGRGVLRLGDNTTPCPLCGVVGVIAECEPTMVWGGIPVVLDGAQVICGCPAGSNRLIAPVDQSGSVIHAPFNLPVSSTAEKKFAKAFVITGKRNGMRLSNRAFLAQVDGREIRGVTDANGIAHVEAPSENSQVYIHVAFKSPARVLTELSEDAK